MQDMRERGGGRSASIWLAARPRTSMPSLWDACVRPASCSEEMRSCPGVDAALNSLWLPAPSDARFRADRCGQAAPRPRQEPRRLPRREGSPTTRQSAQGTACTHCCDVRQHRNPRPLHGLVTGRDRVRARRRYLHPGAEHWNQGPARVDARGRRTMSIPLGMGRDVSTTRSTVDRSIEPISRRRSSSR